MNEHSVQYGNAARGMFNKEGTSRSGGTSAGGARVVRGVGGVGAGRGVGYLGPVSPVPGVVIAPGQTLSLPLEIQPETEGESIAIVCVCVCLCV